MDITQFRKLLGELHEQYRRQVWELSNHTTAHTTFGDFMSWVENDVICIQKPVDNSLDTPTTSDTISK